MSLYSGAVRCCCTVVARGVIVQWWCEVSLYSGGVRCHCTVLL